MGMNPPGQTSPSNPPSTSSEANWTSMVLGGTGYEEPPAAVTRYTPMTDIIQRIYDTVALAVKARLQSGSKIMAVTTSEQVSGVAGVVGTLSNTTVNAGTAAATGLIEVYDGGTSDTVIWAGTLAAGEVKALNLPVTKGIYVSIASGSVAVSYSGAN